MDCASKSNIRSIRISDEVQNIVESFEGNNFNDKFNRIVYFMFSKKKDREAELEKLEQNIQQKRNQYYDLCKRLQEVDDLIKTLRTLQHYGSIAARGAEMIAKGLDHVGTDKLV